MSSFSDTKITPANGQNIPAVDGLTTGYMMSDELKAYILSALGQANGIASLDENGKLPSTQLPDFANDVLAFDNIASFPATGADGVLYIAKDENTLYRWNGTQYVSVNTDTSALKQRVSTLETEVEGLNTEVSALESSSADHGSRISTLETEVDELNMDVSTLETEMNTKADKSDTYTKTEVDAQLALKANAETTYSKTEVDALVESAKPADYEEVKERVSELETEVSTLESSSADHGSRISGLETEVDGLETDVDEHTDRLAQYDLSEVDPFEGFVLGGDGQQNLENMVQNSDVYEQDAIMLSLEPVIPSAATHNFGIQGQIAIDDAYLYICVADNTWKKIPLQNL